MMIRSGFLALHHWLLPPLCLLCGTAGANGRDLCADCTADLPRNHNPCLACALPLNPGQSGLCPQCRLQPPPFERAFAPLVYQPPLDYLIGSLKFGGHLSHARLLGDLFALSFVESGLAPPDCIIPVPLHPRRLRERGFNQAVELAHAIARQHRIPLVVDQLQRTRHTTPQTDLPAHQRRTNLIGAFTVGPQLAGARVALMDDVITTTSTTSECARTLRAAGVTDIQVWAIARTADP